MLQNCNKNSLIIIYNKISFFFGYQYIDFSKIIKEAGWIWLYDPIFIFVFWKYLMIETEK